MRWSRGGVLVGSVFLTVKYRVGEREEENEKEKGIVGSALTCETEG